MSKIGAKEIMRTGMSYDGAGLEILDESPRHVRSKQGIAECVVGGASRRGSRGQAIKSA